MSAKIQSSWAGVLSIVWMVAGYLLIRYVTAPLGLQFEPLWLYAATLFSAWLGVALWIAILGLRSSNLWGRTSAILAMVVFALFTWSLLYPALKPARIRGSTWPNHAASGNGAVASLFHFERLGRAVPEPPRSTTTMNLR